MNTVNVFNEWDPLEEIIVGTIANAQFPKYDISVSAMVDEADYKGKDHIAFPQQVIEETQEDLEILVKTLEKLNIKVHRPDTLDHQKTFSTPDWSTNGLYTYCPRDSLLVVGDMIIEVPLVLRARYFENNAYKNILVEYIKTGAKWLSAPKPRLLDDIYSFPKKKQLVLNNHEPVFDAANIIHAGKDLFYLVSNSGNELGAQWLQTILGKEYQVHTCRNLYDGTHIDTTISFLRPGLALVNPTVVNDDNIPPLLKKWNLLKAPEMVVGSKVEAKFPFGTSVWIGINMLMINPDLAIVDARQKALIKLLEQHKIDVIPLLLRHSRTLGGGFHCVTVGIRRKGKLESYF